MAYHNRHKTLHLSRFHADTGDTASPPSSWPHEATAVGHLGSIVAPRMTRGKGQRATSGCPQEEALGNAIRPLYIVALIG